MTDSMALFYRYPHNYKNISIIDDDISKNLKLLYQQNYQSKFEHSKEHSIGQYSGPSSWTEQLQYYDINSYDDIKSIQFDSIPPKPLHPELGKIRFINKYTFGIDTDEIQHILLNNRLTFLKIFQFRIENNKAVATILNDLKVFLKIIKTVLGDEHELSRKYQRLTYDFDYIIVRQIEGDNTLNQKEKANWISFPTILQLRDSLEHEWRTLLQNKPMLKNTKAADKLIWTKHYAMLLLSCYTLTPPVRRELFGIRFQPFENNDFVYIPQDINKPVEYVLYTIKKLHEPIQYPVGYDKQSGNKLSQLIRESYQLYPRIFLFPTVTDINKQAQPNTIALYFQKHVCDKVYLSINIIRSSFITWRNQNPYYTYNQRKDDANKMRDDILVHLQYYNKVLDPELTKLKEQQETALVACFNQQIDIDKLSKTPEEKTIEYRKDYYQQNAKKEKEGCKQYYNENKFQILLKRNLQRYNANPNKNPTQKTIDKFGHNNIFGAKFLVILSRKISKDMCYGITYTFFTRSIIYNENA